MTEFLSVFLMWAENNIIPHHITYVVDTDVKQTHLRSSFMTTSDHFICILLACAKASQL